MKFLAALTVLLTIFATAATAQYNAVSDSALQRLIQTTYNGLSPEKLDIEEELLTRHLPGEPYFDSLVKNVVAEAEASRDRQLMCRAYNMLSKTYFSFGFKTVNDEQGKQYADRCMQVAEEAGLDEYKVSGYLRYANYYRRFSQNTKALDYNNKALALATSIGNDSLLSIAYTSMAYTWDNLSNKLARFQALLNARDFAEKSGAHVQILGSLEDLGDFYLDISEFEKAKDMYTSAMQKGRPWGEWIDVLAGMRGMGKTFIYQKNNTLVLAYFNKALALADSLHMQFYKVNINLDILNFYLNSADAATTLAYLNSTPAIMQFINAYGIEDQVDKLNGYVYLSKKQYDSALYAIQKGAARFYSKERLQEKYAYTVLYAAIYDGLKKPAEEKEKLLLAKSYADSSAQVSLQKDACERLYQFFDSTGDARQAMKYYQQMNTYNDSLQSLGKEQELLTVEIENTNKRLARQKEEEEAARRTRNNLEYMGITAVIATVFILLVIFGVFKMHPSLIKALGFFAFIFLFEFIVLLLDNQIHELTGGEPWKVLGIKIVIIALLLPLHHKLEERVTHYLTHKAHHLRHGLHIKRDKEKTD
ncbi:MAG TPA: hypothetical protein VG738_10515 [Chitinophagaceae bacterium]|nr:hypothetical protein [Chitinophagaceae bacterium]